MNHLRIAANMWTGKGPVHRCLIDVEDDRIARMIPLAASEVPPDAMIFDNDSLLIPGFHDAHLHFLVGGLQLAECRFHGVSSVEQFSDVLAAYLRTHHSTNGWVQGLGLDETQLQINRTDIDRVCKDIPVFIWTRNQHSAVVNSAALRNARIDHDSEEPVGGRFERDAQGRLTGMLREKAAGIVQRMIPPISSEQARAALLKAQEYAFSRGITAVSSSIHRDDLPHYREFSLIPACEIRINAWRVSDSFSWEEDRFDPINRADFRLQTQKGFADGALGAHSAAFWQPYSDAPENSGMPLVREGPLARWIRAAHDEGYQIALHAIGDRANSVCLDAIEMAGTAGRGPECRPRIEHAQHLRERDLGRFAELGVIASMQPIHCTADMRFVEPRIGSERACFSYAWRSLLNRGAALAFGSDWPIEDLSPINGIHAAVTRQDHEGYPAGGWQPQETIPMEEALKAYTAGGTYAAHWEKDLGTVEEGKLADFAVLSKNLFTCTPREIPDTRVLMTVVGGRIVFRNSQG